MSIWTAKTDLLGRRQCKRCHKMFLPRKEGQEYGPKCARKVAAQEAMWQHIEEVHPEMKITAADDVAHAYREQGREICRKMRLN